MGSFTAMGKFQWTIAPRIIPIAGNFPNLCRGARHGVLSCTANLLASRDGQGPAEGSCSRYLTGAARGPAATPVPAPGPAAAPAPAPAAAPPPVPAPSPAAVPTPAPAPGPAA